jgi:hypothetical protein
LGVAKDQRLSLNPAQISGACGRLMCCLRYEHDFYVQSRKRFPKEAKVLVTARGEEKVVANDIFNERVTLRNVEGETRVVALADLKRELAGGPATIEEPVEEEPDMMMELDEEVIRMTDTAERPAYRPGLRPGMPGFPKVPERPVPLQRRESGTGNRESKSPGTIGEPGTGTSETPAANRRGAPANRVREPEDVRQTTTDGVSDPTAAAVTAPEQGRIPAPTQPPATSDAESTGESSSADQPGEGTRPARRRRGRRGGRRGRGRANGTATPNAESTGMTSGESADNGGDDGEGGEE